MQNSTLQTLTGYVFAVVLCVGLLIGLLGLGNIDLAIPFQCSGDGLQIVFFSQSAIEHGWYFFNDRVGAPFTFDARDWPQAETLHFLLIKALALAIPDAATVVNLYFLLTFPLTVVASLFVFRHFGCSYGPSLVGSLLFAFLPYHFYRNITHLYLASYYCLPLILMVILWLYQDRVSAFQTEENGRTRFRPWNRRMLVSLLLCVLLGLGDVYYTFFAAYLIGVIALARLLLTGQRQVIVTTALLIGTLLAGSLANAAPTLLHTWKHGKNQDAANRMAQEADFYGLRITQMLLPIGDHRVELLARARNSLVKKMELVNENEFAALGAISSVGFLVLMVWLLKRRPEPESGSLLDALSLLNVSAVLLATMGGFGLLIARLLPQIRAYNRMSVLIAFFSLFAVVLLLDQLGRRMQATRRRCLWGLGLGVLALLGILDQTPRVVLHPEREKEFARDRDFVRQLEARLPLDAMIYQLPYRPFPEGGSDDHLRLSIHSHRLRWSWPVMRGRPEDFWHKQLQAKDPEEMAVTLALVGFEGICIDRQAYRRKELTPQLEKHLAELLKTPPLVSEDQRYVFFELASFTSELQAKYTPEEWRQRCEQERYPVVGMWTSGFVQTREMIPPTGRWCASKGELVLYNFAEYPQKVTLRLRCRTGFASPAALVIDSPLLQRQIEVNNRAGEITETVIVQPGKNRIHFHCDALPYEGNARRIFRVTDFRLEPVLSVGQRTARTSPR